MYKKGYLPWMFALIFGVLALSACGTSTIDATYFKRDITYVSASEVPQLMEALRESAEGGEAITSEKAVEIVSIWADAKYDTSTTAGTGYEQRERLNVPYRSVGVLHVGSYTLVLPQRTYTNVPTGDDELTVVAALCIDPGKIAWKFNFEGQRELRTAQNECYLEPWEGWTLEDALKINNGEIAWRLSPDGVIERKTEIGVYPTEFLSEWRVEKYLVVDPGKTAYRMADDGTIEFRSPNPGSYPDEILSQWTVVDAVQIGPNEFGIYIKADRSVEYLTSGVHYDVVPSQVNKYPTAGLRYRTLAEDVYNTNPEPDSEACASAPIACGTVITGISISGTQRLAAFNVDVGFVVENPGQNQEVLAKFLNLGELVSAARDNIEGPVREAARSVCSDMTQEALQTETGKLECELRILTKVQGKIDEKGIPLRITSVNIRSRNFNDEDLRAAAAAAEVLLQNEADRIALAEAQVRALEAETVALKALQDQINAKMDSVNQVIDVRDGVSCTELTLLASMGVIELDWEKLPKEMCQSAVTSINVNAP